MSNLIKIKRGLKANLPTLADGEMGFCTDTLELYIGDSSTNKLIANIDNFLAKDNTTSFTPSGDHHPATKKYVDDSVGAAGGGDMLKSQYDNTQDVGVVAKAGAISSSDGVTSIDYTVVNAHLNSMASKHREINDVGTTATDLLSAEKILALLVLKQTASEKGQANGYAGLGADSKVPTAQLPDAVLGGLSYQGTWNAATNTPTIPAAATANKGYYYRVSVAGSTNVDGITDWKVNDLIVSNGSAWEKIDNTDQVTSVAGKQGAITLVVSDITDFTSATIDGGTFV